MPALEDILAILGEQHALLSKRYPIRRLALLDPGRAAMPERTATSM
jgi:hypothetical protein